VYDPQSLNRYSFENNNPYFYIDQDGHWAFTFDFGGGAGAGPNTFSESLHFGLSK